MAVYGNGDTHAIGVQGGAHNIFTENLIDRVGGSGITMYQCALGARWGVPSTKPKQAMFNNTISLNRIFNVHSRNPDRNMRGIDSESNNDAAPAIPYSNRVMYNVLSNITKIALNAKSLDPQPEHQFSWLWANNAVINSSIGFFSGQDICGGCTNLTVRPAAQMVVNNLFVASSVAHVAGVVVFDPRFGPLDNSHNDIDYNLYWNPPAELALPPVERFCTGYQPFSPGHDGNCTSFQEWRAVTSKDAHSLDQLDPLLGGEQVSHLADRWETPFLPHASSPLRGRGVALTKSDKGVTWPSHDMGGQSLLDSANSPSIGAFVVPAQ
eukprot:COSAG06_NODE_12257_length_1403_cov_1.080521_1_plen_324_part_00